MFSEFKAVHAKADPIEGWLSPLEGELLYRLARDCSRGVIVEIGSFQGKSTVWLATGSQAGNRAPVYAVDPHTGSPEYSGPQNTLPRFRENIQQAGLSDIVRPLVMTSAQAARDFDQPVGLLFVDGSHEYEAVRQDFELWAPKLLNGGAIAFHDSVHSPGPARLTAEMVYQSRQFKNARFVHSTTYALKTAQNSPPERLQNRLRLALRGFYALTGKIPLPAALKRVAGGVVRGL